MSSTPAAASGGSNSATGAGLTSPNASADEEPVEPVNGEFVQLWIEAESGEFFAKYVWKHILGWHANNNLVQRYFSVT